MIDAVKWAQTAGLGRAPLLPDPQPQMSPSAQIARQLLRLQYGMEDNRVLPGDRPVGALVRDPMSMSPEERFKEYQAWGGLGGSLGTKAAASAPGAVLGMLAAPGAGTALGAMGREGVDQRQRDLSRAMTGERVERSASYQLGQRQARDAFNKFRQSQESRTATTPGGTRVFTQGDVLPRESGSSQRSRDPIDRGGYERESRPGGRGGF